MQYGGEWPPLRCRGQDGGEGVAVGHVARRERHLRAQGPQFLRECLGSRCGRAAAAEQQQVFRALGGQSAGEVGGDPAGAARDEHGAARLPRPNGPTVGEGCAHQPSGVDGGSADRELVLAPRRPRQQGGQQCGGALAPGGGQVDQPAPPVRLFQADDLSESPQLRGRAAYGIARGNGGTGPRQPPQRRVHAGGVETAYEDEGVVGGLQEGHDPRVRALDKAVGGRGDVHLGSCGAQRLGHLSPVAVGDDHQPSARRWGGGGRVDPPPGHPVPPGIDGPGRRGPGGGGRLGPEPLVLEGVGGQVDGPGTGAGEAGPPVDGRPAHVRLAQGQQHATRAALAPAERAGDGDLAFGGLGRVLHRARQHGVRADLDEEVVPLLQQCARGLLEPHRLPEIAEPVRAVEPGRVETAAGDAGVERHPRRRRCHGAQQLRQLLADRVHMGGVRGVVHGDAARPHPGLVGPGEQFVEGSGVARDHDGGRAVDRREIDPPLPARERLACLVGGELDGDHATPAGEREDRLRAQRDHPGAVLEGQGSGDDRRRDLALGVPDHRRRLHAVRPPHLRKRHHHRPQHGLDHVDPRQLAAPGEDFGQRPVDEPRQRLLALGHPRGEDRGGLQQLHRHTGPLRALPREHEDGFGVAALAGHQAGRVVAFGQGPQPVREVVAGVGEDDGAVGEGGAGGGEGVSDVGGGGGGVPGQVGQEAVGLAAQGGGGGGGERPGERAGGGAGPRSAPGPRSVPGLRSTAELRSVVGIGPVRAALVHGTARHVVTAGPAVGARSAAVAVPACPAAAPVRGGVRGGLGGPDGRDRPGGRGWLRGLLQEYVHIGAADPERRHAGPPRTPRLRPLAGLRQQFHGARRPVDLPGRLVHVQRLRQHPVPQRQHRLDHTGHAGHRLRMPDVRLQRPHVQRPFTVLAVGRQQRLRLDRIAQTGAGAVRLHRVHVGGRQARVRQCLPDHPLLGGTVGGAQAVRGTVLVGRRAPQHGQYGMSVAARVGEAFEEDDGGALAPADAVGGVREGLAAAVGGEAALAGEDDETRRGREDAHPGGQGQGAVALAQRLAREVQGDEGGGTRGVDGDRRALQPQGVRDPTGHHAAGAAGDGVALVLDGVHEQGAVAGGQAADENSGAAAAQRQRVDPGPFDRLPGRLQEQSLLGVHREGLARRDPEQGGVEVTGVVEERAVPRVGLARLVGVGIVEVVEIPATVGGQSTDGVHLVGDELPQLLGRVGAAGQTTRHADDGQRLAPLVLGLAQPVAGLLQLRRDPPQIGAELVLGHGRLQIGVGDAAGRGGRGGPQPTPRSRSMRSKISSSVADSRTSAGCVAAAWSVASRRAARSRSLRAMSDRASGSRWGADTAGSRACSTRSSSRWTRRASGGPSGASPSSSSRRSVARAVGVGWSKTRVAGSRRPVAAFRRLRSSVAVSESNPRSLNGRSGVRSSGEAWPSTAAACSRTDSTRVSCRSRSVSLVRRSRSRTPSPSLAPSVSGRSPRRARAASGISSISGRRRASA